MVGTEPHKHVPLPLSFLILSIALYMALWLATSLNNSQQFVAIMLGFDREGLVVIWSQV